MTITVSHFKWKTITMNIDRAKNKNIAMSPKVLQNKFSTYAHVLCSILKQELTHKVSIHTKSSHFHIVPFKF